MPTLHLVGSQRNPIEWKNAIFVDTLAGGSVWLELTGAAAAQQIIKNSFRAVIGFKNESSPGLRSRPLLFPTGRKAARKKKLATG